MHRMRIKRLRGKDRGRETTREKVGEEWRYVWNEDKRKRKTDRGGGRRETGRGIMRLHEVSVKQDKRKEKKEERKSKREGGGQLEEEQMEEEFFCLSFQFVQLWLSI